MHAAFKKIILAGICLHLGTGVFAATETLTNAAPIRRLTPQQAEQGISVRLRGVVLADAAGGNALVVHDGSEAIYATGAQSLVDKFRSGDFVEISGQTDPGGFAPIVAMRECSKLGTAPLPKPRRVTFDDLERKLFDAQFVEIAGVVRSCEPSAYTNDIRSKMVIETGGERLALRLHSRLLSGSLVDAEVLVSGICFYRHTASRQFLAPMLDVAREVEIQIQKPAPENAWDMPLLPVADLMKFSPERDYGHRVRIHGTVTSQQTGNTLWLRDGDHGLRVVSDQNTPLEPGDEVDLLGFPAQGVYSPIIEDAVFKKIATTHSAVVPPDPVLVTNLAAAVNQDAGLIQVVAKLNAKRPVQNGWVLTLDWQNKIIEARINFTNSQPLPSDWQQGSRVRIAGICSVVPVAANYALSGLWEPDSFSLQMRSPADLVVVESAPWWTPGRIILALVAAVGILLLVMGVLALLARKRLNEQDHQRAMAEAEFTAILAERNRMAREIHDTLAQGLVATSLQLRLAKKSTADVSASLHQHLDAAQQLVRDSLEEARNSIWNMRSQVLETGDLVSALKNILKQMADGTELKTKFEVTGHARRLSPMIESNLLRVGQEAVTNATKHSQASQLNMKLEFGEKHFRLVVTDDGRGFDAANPQPRDDGFGLLGMRERAAELKGELTIRSVPGEGSVISLSVPLEGE